MSAHDARGPAMSRKLIERPWRVGGSVGRTIYAVGPEAEALIGMVDSQELARSIVEDHNTMHAARQGKHAQHSLDGVTGGEDA